MRLICNSIQQQQEEEATSNMNGLVISNKEYDNIMVEISKMKPSKRKN